MLNIRLYLSRFFLKRFRYGMVSQLDLKEFLCALLLSSSDLAGIFIVVPELKEIFGFKRSQGTGFQLNFPISPKALLYYDEIKIFMDRHGINSNYEVRIYGKRKKGFLSIDAQHNIEVASEIIRIVLQELFSLKADSRVEVYYTIDSPQFKKFKVK